MPTSTASRRIRPGHHAPLGSVARRWFVWNNPRLPQIGDIAMEASGHGACDEDIVRRCYRVVGVEEGRTRLTLLLERVEHGTLPESGDWQALWSFYRLPANSV